MVSEVQKSLPGVKISGANAGLHLLLTVKNGMTEAELIASAQKRGVRVYGLSQYYLRKPEPEKDPCLLLGYAAMNPAEISDAIRFLREAWR